VTDPKGKRRRSVPMALWPYGPMAPWPRGPTPLVPAIPPSTSPGPCQKPSPSTARTGDGDHAPTWVQHRARTSGGPRTSGEVSSLIGDVQVEGAPAIPAPSPLRARSEPAPSPLRAARSRNL